VWVREEGEEDGEGVDAPEVEGGGEGEDGGEGGGFDVLGGGGTAGEERREG
jgi:hypothetical protein